MLMRMGELVTVSLVRGSWLIGCFLVIEGSERNCTGNAYIYCVNLDYTLCDPRCNAENKFWKRAERHPYPPNEADPAATTTLLPTPVDRMEVDVAILATTPNQVPLTKSAAPASSGGTKRRLGRASGEPVSKAARIESPTPTLMHSKHAKADGPRYQVQR